MSSEIKMDNSVLFIGKWHPFHNGHHKQVEDALARGFRVVLGCMPPGSGKNAMGTVEVLKKVFRGKRVIPFPMPFVDGVMANGEMIQLDVDDKKSNEIMDMLNRGNGKWKNEVPRHIARYLSNSEPTGQVIWMTGWSGSGKSTIANELMQQIKMGGEHVKILDGDEVREGLTHDLGFSKEDRDENIKRISYTAKCIADVGGVAIVAAISPYKKARMDAKNTIGAERFIEVYVKADLETLKERDPKGLYKRALSGEIKNFTGISDPYEEPENPDIIIDTSIETNPMTNAGIILALM